MTPLLEPDVGWRRAVQGARLTVVLILVTSVALGLYLGWKEGYLRPSKEFYFRADDGRSISSGMAVYLSGFKIGQVSDVTLRPDHTVYVTFAIYRPYLELIREDSEVALDTGGLIGDYTLEIVGGRAGTREAEPGSELSYGRKAEWSDELAEVIDRIEPMIENVDALLVQARSPDGEVQTILRDLAATTSRLESWMPGFLERTESAVAALERTTVNAERLVGPLAEPKGDLQTALRDVRRTAQELPPLVDDLGALTDSLSATAETFGRSVDEFAPELPGLVREGRQTASGASDVVDAVKELPLIRSNVDDRTPRPVLPTTRP